MRKTENWRAEKRCQQALFGENSEKQRKERVKTNTGKKSKSNQENHQYEC